MLIKSPLVYGQDGLGIAVSTVIIPIIFPGLNLKQQGWLARGFANTHYGPHSDNLSGCAVLL